MNSIVTLKRLVELLSQASGKNMAYVDAYLRAFSEVVRSSVAAGESVKVKGLGTFALEPTSRTIVFEPDPELAQAVNEPFAMFPTEEVASEIEDDIADPDFVFDISIPDPAPVPAPDEPAPVQEVPVPVQETPAPVQEPESAPAPVPTPEPIPEPEQASAPEPVSNIDAEEVIQPEGAPNPYPEYSYDFEEEEEKPSFPVFWVVWSIVIGAIVGLLIGFFLHDPIMGLFEPSLKSESIEQTETDLSTAPETIPEPVIADVTDETIVSESVDETSTPEETPSVVPSTNEIVYDHVTTTISDLALKHYGNKNYWVYIYLENKNKISNPNKISSNVQLVIPPREKYEVGNTEAEKAENAKQKANEILKGIK